MSLISRFLLLATVLLLGAAPSIAQQSQGSATPTTALPSDVIVKRNGDDIAAQVVEVTPDLVKYRRIDNLQGPLFSIYRTEVFMIRYANGTKEVFNQPLRLTAPATASPGSLPPPPLPALTTEDSVFAPVNAAGPRIGITVIGNGKLRNRLRDEYHASNVISQFGWQFEQRLFTLPHGPTGLIEFVPLIGGLEQGLFLPSVSAILGIRSHAGLEVGVGPNLSLAGAGLVLAAGHTVQGRFVNVPINFAVVPSREGPRYSLLVGFTYRTR